MRKILFLLLTMISSILSAQEIEMADQMRADGKIYVVVGVLLIIMIGLLLYLVSIDRKVGRMEKKIKEENK